jgi:hypothetical protein
VLSAYEAATGHAYQQRSFRTTGLSLPTPPMARHFTSEEGDVHAVKAGPAFELLARLRQRSRDGHAVIRGVIYYRTKGHPSLSATASLNRSRTPKIQLCALRPALSFPWQ